MLTVKRRHGRCLQESEGMGEVAVCVKGQFNTPPEPPMYCKTMKQLEDLERFFQAGKANKRGKVLAEAANLAMSTRNCPGTGRHYYSRSVEHFVTCA